MTVEEHKNNDEAEIKRVIEGYVEALRAKDLEGGESPIPRGVPFAIPP